MNNTLESLIKSELFNADINYYQTLDEFKKEFPHGINFCYETVSSKAATMYARLEKTEAVVNALCCLVEPVSLNGDELENERRRFIDEYNTAETEEGILAAEQSYFALFNVKGEN